jgi:hypothetical protein
MDHQMYALGMAQALVHHYMVQEPDKRLRNKSIGIGNCSEGKRGDKGGIIIVPPTSPHVIGFMGSKV